MSELIQESKYITVDEFIPKWTALIESGGKIPDNKSLDNSDISLTTTNTCLVGEAYGLKPWTNNYTDKRGDNFCERCKGISMGGINGVTFVDATENLKNLYKFKQGLYDHFMEAHPENLLRKGI